MRTCSKQGFAITLAMAAGLGATALSQGTVPAPPAPVEGPPVAISVDLGHSIGDYKPIYSWFGYDEGNYTTTRNGSALLRELHDLSPAPVYIRVHHLLTSGNGVPELKWSSTNVYTEDAHGKPVYDFSVFDGIFDQFQAAGVRPVVELGFMPEDLAEDLPSRHEPYQVHYPQSTISGKSNNPPKDYRKWQELCRVVTAHLVERYGRDTVQQWFFEVWNEPDIDYWHAEPEAYWKLYDFAVAGVRAALPDAKVGGPASTGPRSPRAYEFLKNFLEHVNSGRSAATEKQLPMDFISFHAKGQPKIVDGQVTMGIAAELMDIDRGFSLISSYPKFRHLPIILSEADPEGCAACSSKVNPANNYRNGTLYPAYTAAAFKRLFQLQDKYNVNLLGMLSWSFEFEGRDYFEGFRSLATNGVDKPVLNFFRMAALMNGTRVAVTSDGGAPLEQIVNTGVREKTDVDALATRSSTNSAAVMLWNYRDADRPGPVAPTTLAICGLPATARRILVSQYRIDDAHSNAYTVWKEIGSPQHPTSAQYAKLQSASGLQLLNSPTWTDVRDGCITLKTDMPQQSISLITVNW